MTTTDVVVLPFGDRLPRRLRGLSTVTLDDITNHRRVVVVGSDADLATVLRRLLRTDRLDIEVAHVPGHRGARRAISGVAQRVPLIRDDTGQVIVGSAQWCGTDGLLLHGEAVVDDTMLFDGEVRGVRIEPTPAMPGLRARVSGRLGFSGWVAGRAAQLGTPGAVVVRDGVPATRPVKRSTFYRHTEGWLRVE